VANRAAVTAAGDKPEEYDERIGSGIRNRVRMHNKGWRKVSGEYICPVCAGEVLGHDLHDRAKHDGFHLWLNDQFDSLDGLLDEYRAEVAALEETVTQLSARVGELAAQAHVFATILGAYIAPGHSEEAAEAAGE